MTARTLVVVPNWVGDVVMALPTLEALAASGREIDVLARPGLAPLLGLSPQVAEVLSRAGSDATAIQQIRRRGYREAVILPGSFRAAWIPFRGRVAERWGYRGQWRSALLTHGVRRPRGGRHQIDDYRALLAALGASLPEPAVPRLDLAEEARRSGAALLERAGLEAGGSGPLVGIFPGAEFGRSKRWPLAQFVELAQRIRRSVAQVRLATLVGPKEVWLGVRIHEQTGRAVPVLGPDLDLAGLASVLFHFDLLVTNDSGPMHLAAALGVPCVALFGPTDPRRTSPAGEGHQVLYTDRWCSPCFRRSCPLLHHRCLRDIEVGQVIAALTRGLEKGGPGPPIRSRTADRRPRPPAGGRPESGG
jgi:heptosyltransferase-2